MMNIRATMAAAGGSVSKWPLWDGTLDGAEAVFNSGNSTNISLCALSETNIVAFYTDASNSSYATACAGTISGTTISWGAAQVVTSSAMQVNSIVALNANQALTVWRDTGDSSKCKAVILDVSGTSITVNSIVAVTASGIDAVYAAKLSSSKTIVAYNVTSTEGQVVVLSISGSAITVETPFVFNGTSNIAKDCCIEAVSSTQAIVFYADAANSSYGTAQVLDIDGSNNITGNSEHVFNSDSSIALRCTALSDSVFAVLYKDAANSNYGTVQVVTVSGVMPSSGTKVAFNNATASRTLMNICKVDSKNAYIFFRQVTTNKGAALIATLSGTDITLQSAVIINDATSSEFACTPLNNSHICAVFKDQGDSNAGTGKVSKSG